MVNRIKKIFGLVTNSKKMDHDYYPDRHDLGFTLVINNLVKKNTVCNHYKNFDSFCVFKKI